MIEAPFESGYVDDIPCPSCKSKDHWEQELGTYYEADDGGYNLFVCKHWVDNDFGLAETCYQKIWVKDIGGFR